MAEREKNGRFAKGNAGGPGNPLAGQVAKLRGVLLACLDEETMRVIVQAMIRQAMRGDVAAAKLLFQYGLGKPIEVPLPGEEEGEEPSENTDSKREETEAAAQPGTVNKREETAEPERRAAVNKREETGEVSRRESREGVGMPRTAESMVQELILRVGEEIDRQRGRRGGHGEEERATVGRREGNDRGP